MRVLTLTLLVLVGLVGCGSDETSILPDAGSDSDGTILDGSTCEPFCGLDAETAPPCRNLQCRQVTCEAGATTSLSGTVTAPEGTLGIYNAIVYVPNDPTAPIQHGATCDKCGQVSGSPVTSTLTDTAGHFVLKNVPVGQNVPVVIQIGKWRRQIVIPAVQACLDQPVATALTHLPRNKAEGDIPRVALTTGGADPLECLPRKLGLDAAEISNPNGTGSVNLYQGAGGSRINVSTPTAQSFWTSEPQLKSYDMIMLGCEGAEHNENKGPVAMAAMKAYADQGGRVFTTHFQYTWLQNGPPDFASTATFLHTGIPDPIDATINDTFPKGKAFADWMALNGSLKSSTPPVFTVREPRRDVTTVLGASTPWVTVAVPPTTLYYSFNTPVTSLPENQCGKVVFSDLHVSSGDAVGGTFPAGCTTTTLTPQEKALVFLLFDLASCVQDDTKDPVPVPN